MNPEDVPEELLSLYGRNYMGSSSKVAARRAMAAVIPEIERQVRERVAAEIMAKAAEYADTLTGPRASFRRGMEAAARHVLPEPTVREIADAIANGDAVFCDLPDDAERGES